MLRLKNIEKSYDKKVLSQVSFTLSIGERLSVMGASGSGKTTLLRIIAGLEAPDCGSIKNDMPVGMVFQENRLIAGMTALGNLTLVTGKRGQRRAEMLLNEAGLGDALHQRVSTLSGGQKRRVAILRALMSDSRLLLFDEPLKGLDEILHEKMLRLLLRECAGRAAILVTHDPKEAELFGDRMLDLSP